MNKNRTDSEKKIAARGLGWALKRLSFKKIRLGDTIATRATQLELKLMEHLDRATMRILRKHHHENYDNTHKHNHPLTP